MAEFKFIEGTRERAMFVTFQKIVQRFYVPEEQDFYWDELHKVLIDFEHTYTDILLAKYLAVAMYKAMDEVFNKTK